MAVFRSGNTAAANDLAGMELVTAEMTYLVEGLRRLHVIPEEAWPVGTSKWR